MGVAGRVEGHGLPPGGRSGMMGWKLGGCSAREEGAGQAAWGSSRAGKHGQKELHPASSGWCAERASKAAAGRCTTHDARSGTHRKECRTTCYFKSLPPQCLGCNAAVTIPT